MLAVMHLHKFSCHSRTCRKYRFACRLWTAWPIIFLAFCWLLVDSKILSSSGRTQDIQGDTTLSLTLPRPIGTYTFLLYFWLANAGIVGLVDFKQIKIIQSPGNQVVMQHIESFLLSQAFKVPVNCHGHNFCTLQKSHWTRSGWHLNCCIEC